MPISVRKGDTVFAIGEILASLETGLKEDLPFAQEFYVVDHSIVDNENFPGEVCIKISAVNLVPAATVVVIIIPWANCIPLGIAPRQKEG